MGRLKIVVFKCLRLTLQAGQIKTAVIAPRAMALAEIISAPEISMERH